MLIVLLSSEDLKVMLRQLGGSACSGDMTGPVTARAIAPLADSYPSSGASSNHYTGRIQA